MLMDSNSNLIKNNYLSNNNINIYFVWNGFGNKITENILECGLNRYRNLALNHLTYTTISKNNFINSENHAGFYNCIGTIFHNNYWDGHNKLTPKFIIGEWGFLLGSDFRPIEIDIPWISIDWAPAIRPHDIPIPEVST
jgi:hypothetical protein